LPVLHAQLPFTQHVFVLPLVAQQVAPEQQIAFAPVPQHFEGLGQLCAVHCAANTGFAAATPTTAAASAPPISRNVFRRDIGVARMRATLSINSSMVSSR
jgi:hypothetical protein